MHARHRVHERDQLRDVVTVSAGDRDRERQTVAVGQRVVLDAFLRAICGVRASEGRPPKTARVVLASTTPVDQSI